MLLYPFALGMELLFAPCGLVFLAGLSAGGVVAGVGYVVPGFFAEESRLVFPGGVGEAAASSALPCCSGAHSDAGARFGREEPPVPGGELLCWSEDAAAAVGLADGRRVD